MEKEIYAQCCDIQGQGSCSFTPITIHPASTNKSPNHILKGKLMCFHAASEMCRLPIKSDGNGGSVSYDLRVHQVPPELVDDDQGR
uniref:Uncharacterized protein n=1 Tax=Oryza sativa subsp. japonica TaxID=39947 RepID=Q6H6V7_ORYSJ|nr:hypothetical protein [Oryza sativa Japonica Group]BAD25542.1 hypothetical protein [Oryza sativa Japonica Group]